MSLKNEFEQAIRQEMSASLDRIETRRCTSDNFDGIQYNFYGDFVPVRCVVDVVAAADNRGIEQMHFTNDVEEPCFGIFVAEVPEHPHPGFVNADA